MTAVVVALSNKLKIAFEVECRAGSNEMDKHPNALLFALRRAFTTLGILQLATLISLVAVAICGAIILHHQTDDYFTPLPAYFQSFKIALPPAAIFIATYVVAFVTGTPIAEAPKAVLAFARNHFLQSPIMMASTIGASMAFGGYTLWLAVAGTPPAYDKVLRLILSGSSDNLTLSKEQVDGFRKANPELASQLGKVIEVFAERSAVNAGTKTLSGERARTFVRALEADASGDWSKHPLRVHALAEAYLLFGQSVERAKLAAGTALISDTATLFKRAIELYEQVSSSNSPLAPSILKVSARNNIGNAYYYLKDNERALGAWRRANSGDRGQPNLSSWGNIIAALVMLDKVHEAVEEGEKARQWAEKTGKALVETYAFAGILENTGFARLQAGDSAGALSDFATAHAFREDDLTRQNLALALIVSGRAQDAQKLLREIAPPADLNTEANVQPARKVAACVYLIWALAMPNEPAPVRAANLAAFLGERYSTVEFAGFTNDFLKAILKRVATALPKSDYPCGSLAKIKAIEALLH